MDTLYETPTEYPMTQAHAMLAATIRSYEPDCISKDEIDSLHFMLKHPSFIQIREVIANKLIDIGEHFRKMEEKIVKTNLEGKPINKPKRTPDNRKKKKKVSNAGDIQDASLTMNFAVDPSTGILVPVK
jgi:hypothetical protein